MVGAIVRAIHIPSGTVYGTDIKENGTFYIQGMRVGGPYKVTVTFGTEQVWADSNINLELGETYQLEINKQNSARELSGVTVTSSRDNLFNNQRTGAATTITAEQMNTLPSISRSVFDFTALSPQSGGGQGFLGRDPHYNNVQINGANFNNSFGLSTGFAGSSGGNPIPLDAIQQIQVAVSDFDLKQSDFTGGNVNLVTKSGTNDFTGEAHTYYRDQSFNGTHVGDVTLPPASKVLNNVYGASIGGPIIKNKLFFFVSGEFEQNAHPVLSPAWVASSGGATGGNVANVPADSLQKASDFVKSKYGYNTGAYPGGPGFNNTYKSDNTRLLANLDYNINEKNKIRLSFIDFIAHSPINANSTSAAGGSLANSRNGINALSFANTQYALVDKVHAYSAELNSVISSNVSNQVLATYNQTRDTRSSPSSNFPFIDIDNGGATNNNYISLGYELFTYMNDVQQNALTVYDNVTVHAGINNFTAGIDYKALSFANSYRPYGTTYYRFQSLNDFIQGNPPAVFGYTYPYQGSDGYSRVHYGLPGVYVEDRVNLLHNRLTLLGGVRADLPLYLNTIPENKFIDTLNLADPNQAYASKYGTAYKTTHFDASKWPTEKVVVAPRFGFNWSPLNNEKLHIRGGSGIFLGQLPFVWLTNEVANNGTVTNNVQVSDQTTQLLKFQPTAAQALAQLPDSVRNVYFPQKSGSSVPGTIAAVDPNFHMPEVWRSDLAADYKLPWLGGMVATAEFVYSKDIYAIYQFNANFPNPIGVLADSNDHRSVVPQSQGATLANKYPFISGAYILANSRPGDSWAASLGMQMPARKGLYGSLFYTHMYGEEVSSNPGSQASSAWSGLHHLNNPNEDLLAPSAYVTPNRIVGTLSYRIEYAKHFATTVSLLYVGATGGRFDWTYNSDINNGGLYDELMYIPHNADEMHWNPIVVAGAFSNDTIFTVAQEKAAFNAFLNQDKYLSSHKGEYMQRNGAQYPYVGTFSLKFIEDFIANIGPHHNSLQFTVDVLNIGNLINKNWGIQKSVALQYGALLNGNTNYKGVTNFTLRTVTHTDNNGNTITFSKEEFNSSGQPNGLGMAPDGSVGAYGSPEQFLPTTSFVNSNTSGSTWSLQLGLRYNFK